MSTLDPARQDAFTPLFTDLYQLTMLQAYYKEGMDRNAVFSLFVRRLGERNYLLACGLEPVLQYLESLEFSDEERAFLAEQDEFDDDFIDALAEFEFTGDVYAVPEGTPVFPDEPIVEVEAPIGEAQLVETFILNQITFQTGLASKSARVVQAARRDGTHRLVADFGMRRMHGTDATMKAARAFHIAGVDATSNVWAGHVYELPITGTMAHSYVEAHETEEAAFRAFMDQYPEAVLLVDTYDTLDGVRRVVKLADEWGDDFQVRAIRLDSGDLADLAKKSREILDDAGLDEVEIFVSGGLDEHKITELLDRGAPIDGFGVGTKMGTSADQPYLDSAYKLSGYAGKPRMKLSKAKSNLPGRKQVFRQFDGGTAAGDLIAQADETADGMPLLKPVMLNGERTESGHPRPLDEIRDYAAEQRAQLPDRLHRLEKAAPPYEVALSSALKEKYEETRRELKEKMEA